MPIAAGELNAGRQEFDDLMAALGSTSFGPTCRAWAAYSRYPITDELDAELLRMKVKLPGAFGLVVRRCGVGAGD